MYDVIVVGARCAGSTTGMLLARKGYRVLVVDRASFPSDTMSTHWIHEPGVARLREWGLVDAVLATGCPPITRMRFDAGPVAFSGSPASLDGLPALAPRRILLDAILVEAARAAGAEVREEFPVHELVHDDDGRVTGVRGGAKRSTSERAALVVGADGLHSLTARAVEAPAYDARPSRQCAYYAYWSGLPTEGVEFYPRDGVGWGTIPTNDGLTCLIFGRALTGFHELRADVEGGMRAAFAEHAPDFAKRVAAARRETRFVGTADLPFYYRRPYGPGWALVGDAGYHKDSITAQGITDAFRDATLVTEAIDAGMSGRLDDALAGYEQARNEATRPMYELTWEFAGLEPPSPQMQQVFAALSANPEQTSRFFGAIAGTVPVAEFFAPDNLTSLVETAVRQGEVPRVAK